MTIDTSNPIIISNENNINAQLMFHNSANFLCNFMKKREYLVLALRDMALKPRYFEEYLGYLGIPQFASLTFPMTCFCDIPLSKTSEHMEEYGRFGIALNKQFCLQKDVQPITYVNKNARLLKEIRDAFTKLTDSNNQIDEEWTFLPNLILSQLLYTKPIDGYMRRGQGDYKHRLFKDECEWRYIPSIGSDIQLILPTKYNNARGQNYYSSALAKDKNTWFSFDEDAIEYIIVPDEIEAIAIISAISKMRYKTKQLKLKLISKIEIADKFQKNLI